MNNPDTVHVPVMPDEVMSGLDIKPDGIYVDCTCGFGGHASRIASRLSPLGKLIAIDQDEDALAFSRNRFQSLGLTAEFIKGNFSGVGDILDGLGADLVDGAIIDLGVSSFQLDSPARGFSYMADGPLDMRMDTATTLTARQVINEFPRRELASIISKYGEERYASAIAAAIDRVRAQRPIESTLELAEIVKLAIPPAARAGGHHPAKRTFQAIRIYVNNEIDIIAPTLFTLVNRLKSGGRLAVITFHSLEDRAAKQAFASLLGACTCPKGYPICVCGAKATIRLINKKPIEASETELQTNPRSRSAKLRVVEKL